MESSRPLGSSLGLLVALGFTELMEVLAGGEGGFAFTGGSSQNKHQHLQTHLRGLNVQQS